MTLEVDTETPGIEKQSFWRDDALAGAWLMDAQYRDHQFGRHLHDEMVVVVTEQGSGEVRTRFGLDRSAPGTVWVFAAGEYHGGQTTDGGAWGYRAMYLDEQALDALASVYGGPGQQRLFVPPGLYDDAQLAHVIGLAHRKLHAGAPAMERQAHWWAAMGMLFGRYGEPKFAEQALGRERTKMMVLRDYVVEHFRRDLSIDELSRQVGLSRYHLMRSFSQEFGMPPHAYVNQLRLIEAKRLLREGVPAAEVAASVGFYDQSHLTRYFKRAFDLTPGAFATLNRGASLPGWASGGG
jgi:AraC-like DNA-binding protein